MDRIVKMPVKKRLIAAVLATAIATPAAAQSYNCYRGPLSIALGLSCEQRAAFMRNMASQQAYTQQQMYYNMQQSQAAAANAAAASQAAPSSFQLQQIQAAPGPTVIMPMGGGAWIAAH